MLLAPILAAICLAALCRAAWTAHGTTLAAPCWWSVLSVVLIAAVEALDQAMAEPGAPPWLRHARYAAAVTCLGPTVAVLGAKRPQDRAWQLIVLTLLVVLALPALTRLALGPGRAGSPHATWIVFLGLVWLAGIVNYIPTRFWPAGLLAGLAQASALGDALDWFERGGPWTVTAASLAFAALAAWLPLAGAPRALAPVAPFDRLWLDFRDWYGWFWGLRIAERFNAAAAKEGWPMELRWGGLRTASAGGSTPDSTAPVDEDDPAARQLLETLLARFVSPTWIRNRVEGF